jgi:hypothetical protein
MYWEIGAFGDTGPANHQSGVTLAPQYSILTDAGDYPGAHNSASNPGVISQYCNGSRVPPEGGGNGFAVPPGIADTVLPNPLFSLLPSATPDEGNQWINMSYGQLSLFNATITTGSTGYGVPLGNYAINAGSPAINAATPAGAPNHDFFGTRRPQGGGIDIGAVELPRTGGGGLAGLLNSLSGANLPFGPGALEQLFNNIGNAVQGGGAATPQTQGSLPGMLQ